MSDRLIVTKREISDGAVSMPRRRTYDSPTMGKYKETHVRLVFPPKTGSYDTLTPTPHNLGKTPTTWTIVERGVQSPQIGDQPGTIYTETPAPFSATHVAFRCTTPAGNHANARTWAVIALR